MQSTLTAQFAMGPIRGGRDVSAESSERPSEYQQRSLYANSFVNLTPRAGVGHSSAKKTRLLGFNFFKHSFFISFFPDPMAVMGELNQLAILALVQVLAQKFVRVVTERQYSRCCRPQIAQFFSEFVHVACHDIGMCFQVLHRVLGIDSFVLLDDVGHVGTVVGRVFESVPNLECTSAFAVKIEKISGHILLSASSSGL